MQTIKCVIIDDEPIARALLADYCSYIKTLNVVASCANAFDARETLLNQDIDLLFLDINMPILDGIGFLRTLKNPPQVIFTTAYRQYAITAFDLSACDYLVKPFSLERFIQAVDKAAKHFIPDQKINSGTKAYIRIKAENKVHNVQTDQVLFAEAKGNYTHIFLNEEILKPKISLTVLEELLPSIHFLRVHRSFIINKTKIKYIEGNRIYIAKYEIPLGNSFKESFNSEIDI